MAKKKYYLCVMFVVIGLFLIISGIVAYDRRMAMDGNTRAATRARDEPAFLGLFIIGASIITSLIIYYDERSKKQWEAQKTSGST